MAKRKYGNFLSEIQTIEKIFNFSVELSITTR